VHINVIQNAKNLERKEGKMVN